MSKWKGMSAGSIKLSVRKLKLLLSTVADRPITQARVAKEIIDAQTELLNRYEEQNGSNI